jgi:hypothetical protein
MYVNLRSKEGQVLSVSLQAARISGLVKETFLDEGGNLPTTLDPDCIMDLHRISHKSLELVIQFMQHYVEDPMILISSPFQQSQSSLEELVSQDWYRTFIPSNDKHTLFQLLATANFMAIQPLLDLLTLYISFQLMGQSTEEIRQYLNLPKLTPEEEERARREYPWIFTLDE